MVYSEIAIENRGGDPPFGDIPLDELIEVLRLWVILPS